jgi:molybdenum cofactor cytidylyltransferase
LISAVILGAGLSTRFGAKKQLVKFEGATLLETVVGRFLKSKVDDVVVVLGYAAEEIRTNSDFGRARVVVNADYAQGLSTSLKAGIDAVNPAAKAAVVALGDQPLISVRIIDLLVEKYMETGGPIVAPFYQRRRGNPVLFDKSLFSELRNIHGDTGAKASLERHADKVVKVQVDDIGVLFDIDTQDDYGRLLKTLEK